MEQFVVPQFIDVEDKIFGPVTTRQFLIMLVAAGFVFVAYKLLDVTAFILALFLLGGSALILAFVKINGQSFHFFLLNIFETLRKPSLRIWRNDYTKSEIEALRKKSENEEVLEKPKYRRVSKNRIRDLSLIVNTGGYYNPNV